jgi:hypothetical protein
LDETTRRLKQFKEYLNSVGYEFVNDENFAGYFNIPYILSVQTESHEEFKVFLEKEWIENLYNDLIKEIEAVSKRKITRQQPRFGGKEQLTAAALRKLLLQAIHFQRKTRAEPEVRRDRIERRRSNHRDRGTEIRQQQEAGELNKLAHRYEALKEEYEAFLSRLEAKKNTVMSQLPTHLIVEKKVKREILEERDRLEADTLNQLVKEKKRRLNPQECKLFKAHFKETIGNYKIVDFEASHNTEHLRAVERLWKSLLLDHAAGVYDGLYEEFAKDNGDLSKKEEAVLKKRVSRF